MNRHGGLGLAVPLALTLGIASDQVDSRTLAAHARGPESDRLVELRRAGRYPEALAVAREVAARGHPKDGGMQQREAAQHVATLSSIVKLSTAARHDLTAAYRASAPIDSLIAEERFAEALPIARRQLEVRARWLSATSLELAGAHHRLGRVEHGLGHYEAAIEHLDRALAIREASLGRDHVRVAETLEMLGQVKKDLGLALEEVMPCYQRALDIRGKAQGRGHPDLAGTWMKIANLYRGRARFDAAVPCFHRALRLRGRLLGPDHPDVAVSHSELALTWVASGEWKRAEPHARRAVEIQRRQAERNGQDYTLSLNTYAACLARRERYADAETLLTESAAVREELRARSLPGIGRSRMYSLAVYQELAIVQLAQGEQAEAWESLERALARTLIESLPGRTLDAPNDSTPRDRLARVQAAIEPDEALVGWLHVRRATGSVFRACWGYVIRDQGPIHWVRLPLDDRDHALQDIWRFSNEIRSASAWPMRVTDVATVSALSRRIHQQWLEPLAPHLDGARRLVVVAPDAVAGVPVECWMDGQGRFAGERFVVTYAPSATWHAWSHEHSARRRPKSEWRALLVGAPELGARSKHPAEADLNAATASYASLPHSRAEVLRVGALVPRSRMLLGKDASEARLHRLATTGELERYDLIHFATHARVDPVRAEESALLLAGSPAAERTPVAAGSDHDGYLSAQEIRREWRLAAELVSLSACQTGLGPLTRTDGFIGLNHAFLTSGARGLLVSLWNVDDTAQALLMERFYENLLGAHGPAVSKGEALHRAKEWLRAQRDTNGVKPFAHPSYWAGFVLIGDPS